MPGKLSEKFQELKNSSGNSGKIRNNNRQRNTASQQQQRGSKFSQQRGLTPVSNAAPAKTGRRPNVRKPQGGKVRIGNKNPNPAGGRRKGGKRPGGAGNKTGNAKKPAATGEDLDKELDTYWFAAGKGPNPDLVSLDRDMDDYFKNKKSTDAEEVNQS